MAVFFKLLIRIYQVSLSPLLALIGVQCRFYPTCSRYALSCLERYSLKSALAMICQRLIKCGPWHPGGVDLP